MKGNTTLIISFILALLLLIAFKATAQQQFRLNKTDSFNLALVIDPNASISENGLNIGAEIEYNGTVYTRASISSFSSLQGGYLALIGAAGINFTSGMWEQFRYYAGLRAGFIRRENNSYPTAGTEIGIDYVINERLILGLRATRDKRSDFEYYNEPAEMRNSGYIKIGIKL